MPERFFVPQSLEHNGYTLELTCSACPEQYDVYRNGVEVGYLRLRHGIFTAEITHMKENPLVYESATIGDGAFMPYERHMHLTEAIKAIDDYIARTSVAFPSLFNMAREEEELLLYLESCATRMCGIYDRRRISGIEAAIMKEWVGKLFIKHGEVAAAYASPNRKTWVHLSDHATELALSLRRHRSQKGWEERTWKTTDEVKL